MGSSTDQMQRSQAAAGALAGRLSRVWLAVIAAVTSCCLLAGTPHPVAAQSPADHYFHSADMPPGSVGWGQLQRSPAMRNYFQPVELYAPAGTQVALSVDGDFGQPQPVPARVGLLVGHVYRLKVTNIPLHEGRELYPSVEIVHRLFPPPGQAARFPIPVHLTREDMELALRGQFVTRVIYLENPQTALPRREQPGDQRSFDVGPTQDPLKVADTLGRPVALVRIGSRVPDADPRNGRFNFASPPWHVIAPPPEPKPAAPSVPGTTASRPAVAERPTSHSPGAVR